MPVPQVPKILQELALSPSQEALWTLQKLFPDSGIYASHFVWDIPSRLDTRLLRLALNVIIERHPPLRTLYSTDKDGNPCQCIYDILPLNFQEVSLEDCDDNSLMELFDQYLHQPFHLDKESSMRWVLFKRDHHPHILATFLHHINFDLWTFMVVINELQSIYTVLADGNMPDLPKLSRTFTNHLLEQQSYLKSVEAEKSALFWQNHLEGAPDFTELPISLPRPPIRTCHKSFYHFSTNQEHLTLFQKRFCTKEIGPFILFESLFHVLIYRYSGQNDIVIGVPTAGRDDLYAGVVGYFTNSIAIRSQIDNTKGFSEFLLFHSNTINACLANKEYPFSLIAKDLTETRDPSRAPLVQICMVWENINRFENRNDRKVTIDKSGRELWKLGAMGEWRRHRRIQQTDDFDLTFKVYKYGDKYHFGIEYNRDLFTEASMSAFAEHFQTLMLQATFYPERPLGQLQLLSMHEYETTIINWNNTQTVYDNTLSLISYVERFAKETPHKSAIEYENTHLRYAEIDQRANAVAHHLLSLNISHEKIVGVYLDRSPEVIIAMLAIMKAGAAYLPLDPDYPRERLDFILEDAKPAVIISRKQLLSASENEVTAPFLFWENLNFEHLRSSSPDIALKPSNLAYIIYTSGSTGKPKGVMIEHGALANFILSQNNTTVESDDRVLQLASINFDASILEICAALHAGATLVMAKKTDVLGPALLTLLKQRKITWALIPPALLSHLEPVSLPELRTLLVGGDACSQTLAKKWSQGRRFFNAYGPTETTIWATLAEIDGSVPPHIGKPIPNTQVYILDAHLVPQPIGFPGELHIGGDGLARGYLNRPDLTDEKFIPNPFSSDSSKRLYKTGDLARFLPDGNIEFLGRIDHQVKIRGFRIELGEIEALLRTAPSATEALVIARDDLPTTPGEKVLVAYLVKSQHASAGDNAQLRHYLRKHLPEYMLPSAFVWLDAFPLTPNEKIDRKALPLPQADTQSTDAAQAPRNEIERIIANTWKACLGLNDVSISENFFDLGGHSLLLAKVHAKLPGFLQDKLTMVDLYKYPTIQSLAHFIESDIEEDQVFVKEDEHVVRMQLRRRLMASIGGVKIAIVGMAGRFPGADTVEEFWQNICNKKESIRFFTPDELRAAGVPDDVIRQPNYVPAKGVLNNVAEFDAAFFNFTPREARITDPQQRLFLECAWQALEDGGCVPSLFKGRIGVYGGVGINQYLANHLSTHPELLASVGDYAVMLGNDKDFLCTRVSYKLNLNGPAMVVQTACSTSLVAVHTACQALLSEECDAALAGGVSLSRYGNHGYFYHDGMIMSPDGHCRTFDADAAGTVQGQGCGLVLLKRLDDALRDNDHIYAVISGSATNNDGSNKTGYTAPSVEGQAKAIRLAQASANVTPSKISYIEAHGTGTPIGDPIEIEALRQTFREERPTNDSSTAGERSSAGTQYGGTMLSGPAKTCAIGSVKTNIGHLDAAAGVAGLIKTALALRYRKLPPSLHFQTPNPKINFQQSPFYVNTELRNWPSEGEKRFAAVSSFGMGGTNAHVILTEPPNESDATSSRPWRLVTLSARTATALEVMTERFVDHLIRHPDQDFANVCYTLHVGRTLFKHRRYLVCRNRDEAISDLSPINSQRVVTTQAQDHKRKVVFLFSGQGSQYVNMGMGLFQTETTFRNTINECRSLVSQKFIHVYEELSEADTAGRTQKINETFITQPALFIFEYAVAKTLMSWGVTPDYMIGHSVGEYVAACLAGVFTLDQALELVAIRGQLIQQLEGGDMLSVRMSEAEAALLTNHDVSLAGVNGEQRCVLSGSAKAIQYLHEQLNRRGIENRILHTSHAFHSHMMEPVLERFAEYVRRRKPKAPTQPFISSLTGEWITAEQATSPQYWADHLRHTVRFHQGLNTLFADRQQQDAEQALIFLEVGPGQALTTLTRQHKGKMPQDWVLATTRHAYDEISDSHHLLKVLGRLWEQGIDIQWDVFHSDRQRYRVPLPTYPFERTEYWVKPATLRISGIEPTLDISGDADTENTPTVTVSVNARPRDELEEVIWKNWALCLGREDFGIFDNFFDLGGDSLIAVNLLDQLRKKFIAPLSTPVLIQNPTIADLAEHIQRHGSQPSGDDAGAATVHDSPLVMIQRGNAKRQPLLMVHPIGGEVFFYRDLARHLGNEQPVYAFQAPSLTGTEPPMNSVYALAERYLAILKARDFKPPYLLGGSSFGGLIAYEMAQQIKRIGEEVRLVVMIDTPAPSQMPRNLTDSAAILQYLLQGKLSLSLEKLRSLPQQAQIDYVLEEARLQGRGSALPPHLGIPLFSTWIAHQEATFAYQPEPYHDDVVFFQHTEPMENFPPNPSEAWEELVEGAMTVHHVPGNHISMNYPPHVKTLANHLKHILRGYLGG